jgi:TetR/AcrR family transcriptional repressor of nem operon
MSRPRSIEDDDLLPKAVRLFWQHGYAETGVRELEQALGLKAPSLYNRFGSKGALFQRALAHYLEKVVRFRIERYLQASDPLLGLRAFFDTTYDYVGEHEPPLGCLLVNTSLEAGAEDPATAAQLRRGSRMLRAAFRQTLRRAQRQGQLSREGNVGALADALHLGLQGLLVTSKVERDKALLRKRTDALFALLPISAAQRKGSKP